MDDFDDSQTSETQTMDKQTEQHLFPPRETSPLSDKSSPTKDETLTSIPRMTSIKIDSLNIDLLYDDSVNLVEHIVDYFYENSLQILFLQEIGIMESYKIHFLKKEFKRRGLTCITKIDELKGLMTLYRHSLKKHLHTEKHHSKRILHHKLRTDHGWITILNIYAPVFFLTIESFSLVFLEPNICLEL